MSLTDRDRKIALAIVPLLVLAAYWFLLLAPKREAGRQGLEGATKQTERRDTARTAANAAQGAKTDFAADYAEIVRLGKAIPRASTCRACSCSSTAPRRAQASASRASPRASAPDAAPASTTDPAPTTAPRRPTAPPPVEAGGAPAQSAPGSAVESANNTAPGRRSSSPTPRPSPVWTRPTSTSTGRRPAGRRWRTARHAGAAATGPTGLETVPLELEFVGNFFSLADFFHDVKRFVRVANENVVVSGRLITVEGVKFASDPLLFPRITAEMTATVYLSPKAQGATAGASPQGPAPARHRDHACLDSGPDPGPRTTPLPRPPPRPLRRRP